MVASIGPLRNLLGAGWKRNFHKSAVFGGRFPINSGVVSRLRVFSMQYVGHQVGSKAFRFDVRGARGLETNFERTKAVEGGAGFPPSPHPLFVIRLLPRLRLEKGRKKFDFGA